MTTKILGLALVMAVTGCNAHDWSETLSTQITGAECEFKREIPDTAEGSDTYLYRIRVEGEVQGPTDTETDASISLLDWTPVLSCPDWGDNCRRDSWEADASPFTSSIDFAMSEEHEVLKFSMDVTGWNDEDGDTWTESANAWVECTRYAGGE